MNPEDVARCQQAIDLANSGKKQEAYEIFCSLHNHGNTEDVTLLYWLAFTTPSLEEAQRAIDDIARLEPDHPKLQALRNYLVKKRTQQEEHKKQVLTQVVEPEPIVECIHCHGRAPSLRKRKVSTGGWVLFASL